MLLHFAVYYKRLASFFCGKLASDSKYRRSELAWIQTRSASPGKFQILSRLLKDMFQQDVCKVSTSRRSGAICGCIWSRGLGFDSELRTDVFHHDANLRQNKLRNANTSIEIPRSRVLNQDPPKGATECLGGQERSNKHISFLDRVF